MRVQDLLRSPEPVVSLAPDATALEAARRMVECEQGSVLVAQDDKLLGIFTERDLMVRVVAKELDPATTRLDTVMSEEVFVTTTDRQVTELRRALRERHIRHVPVVDEHGKVQAVLSVRDLLRADLIETRTAKREMEDYIRGEGA